MKSLGFFRLNAANLQPGVIDLNITHMSIFRSNTYVFVCWPKYVRFYQKSNRTYETVACIVLRVLLSGPWPETGTVLRRCPWC